ncbi:hypothetical protein NBRC116494_18840 [Aurantivibrio plasticivorans]
MEIQANFQFTKEQIEEIKKLEKNGYSDIPSSSVLTTVFEEIVTEILLATKLQTDTTTIEQPILRLVR